MAIVIDIKVNPSSGQSKIILDKSGRFVVYVKSPPQDGKANREVIKLLANQLGIAQQNINIIIGLTTPKKKIKIHGFLTLEDVMHKLGFENQKSLLR